MHILSFISSQNTDLGIIPLALLKQGSQTQEKYWAIPLIFHKPIEQALVLLKRSKNLELAKNFLGFIKTSKIQALIRSNGYDIAQ